MTAVFLWEGASSAKTFRWLFSGTPLFEQRCWQLQNILHWGYMIQPCGQSGALVCLEKRKMETGLEYTEGDPKAVTHSSSVFSPKCLASSLWLSETTNMATISLDRERRGLTECSLRGTKSQQSHLSSCRTAWIRPRLGLRRAPSTEQHLVWQSWH